MTRGGGRLTTCYRFCTEFQWADPTEGRSTDTVSVRGVARLGRAEGFVCRHFKSGTPPDAGYSARGIPATDPKDGPRWRSNPTASIGKP
jgi:hypothetical protein